MLLIVSEEGDPPHEQTPTFPDVISAFERRGFTNVSEVQSTPVIDRWFKLHLRNQKLKQTKFLFSITSETYPYTHLP